MKQINRILDTGTPDELMTWLQKPEGLLPVVDSSRPNLYMDNLKNAKMDKGAVSVFCLLTTIVAIAVFYILNL